MQSRYLLDRMLGQGGMGQVFGAFDRLTGRQVALKRVQLAAENSALDTLPDVSGTGSAGPSSRRRTAPLSSLNARSSSATTLAAGEPLRMALAREFRLLAALRHPNIITVLDFGFDAERQPYFTMELLADAQPLLTATAGLDTERKVQLLVQILDALGYLHRRGILHRDLKPGNVLVQNLDSGLHVKVLDFGLSTLRSNFQGHMFDVAGTLGYLAPEILLGEPPSEASDLYAFGVLAYEVLVGQALHPEAGTSRILWEVLSREIDVSAAPIATPLRRVLQRLLERTPQARYPSARAAAAGLSAAVELPLPEPAALQLDNELQTVALVGRERELMALRMALAELFDSTGALLLLGGESGVGKTRILDELRIMALVCGAQVYSGQTAMGGGAYQVLLDILRQLVLAEPPTELDAAVLSGVAPELSVLLGKSFAPAPALEAQAAQARMLAVIERSLLSPKQPTVILLDDIHWACEETLSVLARVVSRLANAPILIVAGYRDDEAPSLPERLPGSRLLPIKRLETRSIDHLLVALTGLTTHRAELVTWLMRETEGNVFFIMEVLRALAEEAGGLAHLDGARLPEQVMTGGVQAVLRRRLDRVPEWAQRLLELAAVIGRQLDVALLGHFSADLTPWLSACAQASVIDVSEDQWRFAHDKLREAVLAALSPAARQSLHLQAAVALAQHFRTRPGVAAALAYHYRGADKPTEAAGYALLAGQEALALGSLSEAAALLRQALQLQTKVADCPPLIGARTRRLLAEALVALGRLDESAALSEQGLTLLGHPMLAADLAGGRAMLGSLTTQVGKRVRAWGGASATRAPLSAAERETLNETYGLLSSYGEVSLYYCAEAQLFYSMLCITNIADRTGDAEQQVLSYAAMGYAASSIPLDRLAESYLRQAEAALRRQPSLRGERQLLRLRCAAYINRGQWQKASIDGTRGIAVCRAAGDDFGHLFILQMMAWTSLFTGNVEQAKQRTIELRELAERSYNRQFLGWGHGMYSLALLMDGQTAAAIIELEAAFPHVRAAADSLAERFVLSLRAACAVEQAELGLARTYLDAVLGLISTTPILAYATLHSVHFCAETCIRLLALTPPIAQGPLLARLAVALTAQRRLARSLIIAKPRMLLGSGHEANFHGKRDAARKNYASALALAQQLGMQDDVARSKTALAALDR